MIGHGIYVNSVSPGWSMDTDFAKVPDKKAAEEMFNPYFAPFHSL
jgi:NAD(P)-dependent dehydrogenase (short-subunit alcohol dehydrogenase family)